MSPLTTIYIGEFPLEVPDATSEIIDALKISPGALDHIARMLRQDLRDAFRKRIQEILYSADELNAFAASIQTSPDIAAHRLIAALSGLTPHTTDAHFIHQCRRGSVEGKADKPTEEPALESNGQSKSAKLDLVYVSSVKDGDIRIAHRDSLKPGETIVD